MRKILALILVFALALGLCACGSSSGADKGGDIAADLKDGQLLVGYAKVDITPDESMPMGGYGNSDQRMSEGFTEYLYATCIAITDAEGNTVILFGMDLCNTSDGIFKTIRTHLSEEYGIPESSVVLSASHTHSAPDVGSSMTVAQRYCTTLAQKLYACAEEAMADRSPADLYINSAQTEGLNFVRRYVLEGGIYAGYQSDISESGLAVIGHESDADGELQLVKFVRAAEDKKDIMIANFQTHPHRGDGSSNKLLSPNLVGVFREELEKKLDINVLYFTGAAGNINPVSQIEEENITANYTEQGQALAKYAIDAEDSYTKVSGGTVQSTTGYFEGEINHSEDHLVAIAREAQALWGKTNSVAKVREAYLSYGIHSPYHANAIISRTSMDDYAGFDVWAISIGDVALAVAPYEMFDANGMFIKENSPYAMTLIAECANGGNGYFPTEIAFEHGGYEPDITKYVKGSAENLANIYVDLLSEMYKNK